MRRSSILTLLAVSLAVTACKPAPYAGQAEPYNKVTMKLNCLENGGLEFRLAPWRVSLPPRRLAGPRTFTWTIEPTGNVTEAEIVAATDSPDYPLAGPFKVVKNSNGTGSTAALKPGIDKPDTLRTYKYVVNVSCPGGGSRRPFTARIDPDMIIPD